MKECLALLIIMVFGIVEEYDRLSRREKERKQKQ